MCDNRELDRGFGKATQPIAADVEVVPDNQDLESLRAEILSDVARVFPDLELVPKRPALASQPGHRPRAGRRCLCVDVLIVRRDRGGRARPSSD